MTEIAPWKTGERFRKSIDGYILGQVSNRHPPRGLTLFSIDRKNRFCWHSFGMSAFARIPSLRPSLAAPTWSCIPGTDQKSPQCSLPTAGTRASHATSSGNCYHDPVQQTSNGERKIRPILIVDDDPDAQFFLERQLNRIGVAAPLLSVPDGSDAVSLLDRCVSQGEPLPYLVFLDLKMPCANGFEVLEWMRDRQLLDRLSVAVLTSSDEPRDVSRAMALGAHAFLTKPPSSENLLDLVKSGARRAAH